MGQVVENPKEAVKAGKDVTRKLARHAATLRYEMLPPALVDMIKQCVLDTLGVSIGASTLAPEARILVSSMHDEKLFAERALRAGANGYINKQVAITEMVGAIRRVLSGKVYLSPPMTERMVERAARLDSDASRSVIPRLSARELEVFSLLGDGLSTREVAQRLNLSVKTIETHRAQIKRKLGLRNSTELIQRAVEWTLRQG